MTSNEMEAFLNEKMTPTVLTPNDAQLSILSALIQSKLEKCNDSVLKEFMSNYITVINREHYVIPTEAYGILHDPTCPAMLYIIEVCEQARRMGDGGNRPRHSRRKRREGRD